MTRPIEHFLGILGVRVGRLRVVDFGLDGREVVYHFDLKKRCDIRENGPETFVGLGFSVGLRGVEPWKLSEMGRASYDSAVKNIEELFVGLAKTCFDGDPEVSCFSDREINRSTGHIGVGLSGERIFMEPYVEDLTEHFRGSVDVRKKYSG